MAKKGVLSEVDRLFNKVTNSHGCIALIKEAECFLAIIVSKNLQECVLMVWVGQIGSLVHKKSSGLVIQVSKSRPNDGTATYLVNLERLIEIILQKTAKT